MFYYFDDFVFSLLNCQFRDDHCSFLIKRLYCFKELIVVIKIELQSSLLQVFVIEAFLDPDGILDLEGEVLLEPAIDELGRQLALVHLNDGYHVVEHQLHFSHCLLSI